MRRQIEPKSLRSLKRESDQNRLFNGDLETTLYSAAVAQEGMLPRAYNHQMASW